MRAFEAEHGALPEGGWLLLRTGWDARAHDQEAFLNAGTTARTPGLDAECARWLARTRRSSGSASRRSAPTRARPAASTRRSRSTHFLLGAGKYGLTQLANLAELPPTGAVVVVAPLQARRRHRDAGARARAGLDPAAAQQPLDARVVEVGRVGARR